MYTIVFYYCIEPMLISSPLECYTTFNIEQLENEELTSNYASDIYTHLRHSEVIYTIYI